ncbi:hypothetical protein ADUPG1_008480 [Aduncisulcus paluster]|uniref:Uncharacterized protein n=1 Tax=Aduncisulcus paluster TaxID=2918883 RepID=A0ABQ5KV44_9EUKA|nr:hypothetical protein ADUPG1_008480 [Aduncisulcus paluster]
MRVRKKCIDAIAAAQCSYDRMLGFSESVHSVKKMQEHNDVLIQTIVVAAARVLFPDDYTINGDQPAIPQTAVNPELKTYVSTSPSQHPVPSTEGDPGQPLQTKSKAVELIALLSCLYPSEKSSPSKKEPIHGVVTIDTSGEQHESIGTAQPIIANIANHQGRRGTPSSTAPKIPSENPKHIIMSAAMEAVQNLGNVDIAPLSSSTSVSTSEEVSEVSFSETKNLAFPPSSASMSETSDSFWIDLSASQTEEIGDFEQKLAAKFGIPIGSHRKSLVQRSAASRSSSVGPSSALNLQHSAIPLSGHVRSSTPERQVDTMDKPSPITVDRFINAAQFIILLHHMMVIKPLADIFVAVGKGKEVIGVESMRIVVKQLYKTFKTRVSRSTIDDIILSSCGQVKDARKGKKLRVGVSLSTSFVSLKKLLRKNCYS